MLPDFYYPASPVALPADHETSNWPSHPSPLMNFSDEDIRAMVRDVLG